MATVTFYTSTAMDDLAFSTAPWSLFGNSSVFDMYTGLADAAVFGTLTGVGDLLVGNVTSASFDNADSGYAPNIFITALNLTLTFADNFNPSNQHFAVLFPKMLAGADTFLGSAGADRMFGFGGNDTFFTSSGIDYYNGGDDLDTVSYAGASEGLSAHLQNLSSATGAATGDVFLNIENLIGSGFDDTIYGTGVVNRLSGGGGNDLLIGKGGADVLDGSTGSDTAGYDQATAAVRVDLQTPSANTGDAAGDVLISIENVSGSGFNDVLFGNAAANTLRGSIYPQIASGNDYLDGRAGNDQLFGHDGNDKLIGGAGIDGMTGGAGADIFLFRNISETGKTSTTRDIILDFTHNATLNLSDRIDLSLIDANLNAANNQAFIWKGTGAFVAGQSGGLRYFQQDLVVASLDKTIIEGDLNGDRIADFQIQLKGLKALVAADFIL